MPTLTRLLLGFALASAVPCRAQEAASQPAPTVDEVRAQVRRAIGRDALLRHPQGVTISGPTKFLGNKVRETAVFDPAGRFVRRLDGPVPHAVGFDGQTAWQLEFSGQPRRLELAERGEALLVSAALTGAWLEPNAPLHFEIDVRAGDANDLVLRFRDAAGRSPGTVALDRATWRPRQWRLGSGETPRQVLTLTGERDLDGFRLPAAIAEREEGDDAGAFELGEARWRTEPPDGLYAPPRGPQDDFKFSGDGAVALRVERAPTGHLLVEPIVNGRKVGWFIFDTGAGATVLARDAADELQLAKIGEVPAVGAGGAVPAPLHRLDEVQLGPAALRNPVVIALDLQFLTAPLGRRIGGVLGYDFISRCRVEIDLAGGEITLADAGAPAPRGTNWTPLLLAGRMPTLAARFEGHEGLLRVDTGASFGLLFHYPTVQEFKLCDGRTTRPAHSGGVGGASRTAVGRLATLEIGGQSLTDVEADFVQESKGVFADAYTAGVVGGPILRRFVLVLDYPGERVGLRAK